MNIAPNAVLRARRNCIGAFEPTFISSVAVQKNIYSVRTALLPESLYEENRIKQDLLHSRTLYLNKCWANALYNNLIKSYIYW